MFPGYPFSLSGNAALGKNAGVVRTATLLGEWGETGIEGFGSGVIHELLGRMNPPVFSEGFAKLFGAQDEAGLIV